MNLAPTLRVQTWLRHSAERAATLTDIKVWLLAAVTGVLTTYGVIGFILAIEWITEWAYGEPAEMLAEGARALAPWRAFVVPVAGGVIVGFLLWWSRRSGWISDFRCQGVAEVIEARARPPGAITMRGGLINTAVCAIALGSGSSAGREGPAVLLGGAFSVLVSKRFGLSARDSRTLLGCAAAAAVSAAFNAPIAGVLFALEVVLSNYALSIFAPIALSSIIATLIARYHLGDLHRFVIPEYGGAAPLDLALGGSLGLIAGAVSILFLVAAAWGRSASRWSVSRLRLPQPLLPVIAGVGMGAVGIVLPEALGYGYQATTEALAGNYTLGLLTILLLAKVFTTVLCLSCRFGTGVFSGGIFLGAMSGAAFGIVMNMIFGPFIASPTFFAMIGMGAVSGAIIGAPISTTLIVFELTGDYTMTAALMIAVGIATVLTQIFFGTSWFHFQLNQRGYDLSEGPQGVILQTIRVRDVMRPVPDSAAPLEDDTPRLSANQTLGDALAEMSKLKLDAMPVTTAKDQNKLLGTITQIRALRTYNKALVDSHIEHHR
ncbi:chloride channel protein [Parvularcula sp. ZS-1/3]|uniref:Chloride channel protein n=1 Tax=Parvularcula mediterranea TaxID=2732508 RepID=A0A7Y3RNI0_9PROT|nr:chloride channel protein [Parvularcula mediterranea]NNU17342.1 chloride channel protein [Parvularcula mediterranea]